LHIHVVNLDRSPERITEFCSVNRNITATVARFVAVDGRKLHIDQLVQRGLVTKDIMSMFSVGALGCAMSNIALWDIAIASGQAVTTCEDDAILNDRFNECAEALLKTLPPDWDVIFWGYNFDMFMSFELLPGVTHATTMFDQNRMRAKSKPFSDKRSPRKHSSSCGRSGHAPIRSRRRAHRCSRARSCRSRRGSRRFPRVRKRTRTRLDGDTSASTTR
jgi:glycosyl transferase family 25